MLELSDPIKIADGSSLLTPHSSLGLSWWVICVDYCRVGGDQPWALSLERRVLTFTSPNKSERPTLLCCVVLCDSSLHHKAKKLPLLFIIYYVQASKKVSLPHSLFHFCYFHPHSIPTFHAFKIKGLFYYFSF